MLKFKEINNSHLLGPYKIYGRNFTISKHYRTLRFKRHRIEDNVLDFARELELSL